MRITRRISTALVATLLFLAVWHLSRDTVPRNNSLAHGGDEVDKCLEWMATVKGDLPLGVDFESTTFDPRNVEAVRIFNQCVFKLGVQCEPDVEQHLFPWLTRTPPTITKNGNRMPLFQYPEKGCILSSIHSQLHSKGIVVSATERHFKGLIHLITYLRVLEVDIPLQIVHKGDISEFVEGSLNKLASADLINDEEVSKILNVKELGSSLPPLEIMFVNVSKSISGDFKYAFNKFANKFLAYLFNSFSEMILIDVDTVPFVPLQEFFNLAHYKHHGALFFRDRTVLSKHPIEGTPEFFENLLPHAKDSIYGIQLPTKKTLSLPFFSGFHHLQEAGVVVVNRTRKFYSAPMAISMVLHKNSLTTRVWGDKELYWLSLSVSGDEDYHFNGNAAASLGEIPTDPERTHYPDSHQIELCSNHPGHIDDSDNHTLLWMNSGFTFCKRSAIDIDNPFYKGMNITEISEFNKSPLKIKHALIPPEGYNKPNLDFQQIPWGPWIARDYCEMYTICAYYQVGESTGLRVDFTDGEQDRFEHLGIAWSNAPVVMKILRSSHVYTR